GSNGLAAGTARALEQSHGLGHAHQAGILGAAPGFAKDQDSSRISAELRDVVVHPLERENQVELTYVSGIPEVGAAELRQVEISENIQTVVHTDHHHIAALAETNPVRAGRISGAGRVTAAMEPDHDWTLATVLKTGSPDAQVQTVFAHGIR